MSRAITTLIAGASVAAIFLFDADFSRVNASPGPSAGSGSAEPPIPKITSVSPSYIIFDGQRQLRLALRGDHLSDPKSVTFETQPSTGLNLCTRIESVHDGQVDCIVELRSKTQRLTDVFPIDAPVHFVVAVKSGSKTLVSEPSSSTFTAAKPTFASEVCVTVATEGDVQLRMSGKAFIVGSSVVLTKGAANSERVTCGNAQVIGTEDAVCYLLRRTYRSLVGEMRVQVVRPGDQSDATKSNSTLFELPKICPRGPRPRACVASGETVCVVAKPEP